MDFYINVSRVLVIGGLGFIGSNLVQVLRARNHEVWIADLKYSNDPNSIRCDITNFRQIEKLFEEQDFQYVYHAAAEYSRSDEQLYNESLWNVNVVGTMNIIRMQEKKDFRMIFLGSGDVYGNYDGQLTEDLMDKVPIKQVNDFGMSKWVNEMQIINSMRRYGTETVRVRLFNVYGPGEYYAQYRGFIPHFIYKALHEQQYTVYFGHKVTLEFVDDVVKALANLIERFNPGAVYNLASDEQYDMKYVSDLILKYLGKGDSKVLYKEANPYSMRLGLPDSTKAKKELGFKITVEPEEGIQRTVEWFKKEYGFKEQTKPLSQKWIIIR